TPFFAGFVFCRWRRESPDKTFRLNYGERPSEIRVLVAYHHLRFHPVFLSRSTLLGPNPQVGWQKVVSSDASSLPCPDGTQIQVAQRVARVGSQLSQRHWPLSQRHPELHTVTQAGNAQFESSRPLPCPLGISRLAVHSPHSCRTRS